MHERKNRNMHTYIFYDTPHEAFPVLKQTFYRDLVVHNESFSLIVLPSDM